MAQAPATARSLPVDGAGGPIASVGPGQSPATPAGGSPAPQSQTLAAFDGRNCRVLRTSRLEGGMKLSAAEDDGRLVACLSTSYSTCRSRAGLEWMTLDNSRSPHFRERPCVLLVRRGAPGRIRTCAPASGERSEDD